MAGGRLNGTAVSMGRARGVRLLLDGPWVRAYAIIVAAALLLIPTYYTLAANDAFRGPKLYLFRVMGILLGAVLALEWIWNRGALRTLRPWRPELFLTAAIVLWTSVTTATSTNRLVSVFSLLTVLCAAALFVAVLRVGPSINRAALYLLIIPALVNGGVFVLQSRGIWVTVSPQVAAELPNDIARMRVAEAALLGNRNDVGMLLVLPTVLAWRLALGRTKWLLVHATASIALTLSLAATRTFTAIGAAAVGVVVLFFLRSWKSALLAVVVVGTGAAIYASTYTPVRYRFERASVLYKAGDYNALVSGRLPAFRAAWNMFRDHPLTGVGPGRYSGNFFTYILAEGDGGVSVNFGETHNDHLQILSETGIIGYGLFLAALTMLALRSWRLRNSGERQRFAADASVAFAAAAAVLCVGQFPLQIAATIVTWVTCTAVLRSWSEIA